MPSGKLRPFRYALMAKCDIWAVSHLWLLKYGTVPDENIQWHNPIQVRLPWTIWIKLTPTKTTQKNICVNNEPAIIDNWNWCSQSYKTDDHGVLRYNLTYKQKKNRFKLKVLRNTMVLAMPTTTLLGDESHESTKNFWFYKKQNMSIVRMLMIAFCVRYHNITAFRQANLRNKNRRRSIPRCISWWPTCLCFAW